MINIANTMCKLSLSTTIKLYLAYFHKIFKNKKPIIYFNLTALGVSPWNKMKHILRSYFVLNRED